MKHIWMVALACAAGVQAADDGAEQWYPLFNGRDLSGWTVKIAKHPLGENYADTFRVEDGVIKVAYDRYGKFDEQFGHLPAEVTHKITCENAGKFYGLIT